MPPDGPRRDRVGRQGAPVSSTPRLRLSDRPGSPTAADASAARRAPRPGLRAARSGWRIARRLLPEPAGDRRAVALLDARVERVAGLEAIRAAGREVAALGHVERIGHRALDDVEALAAHALGRDGREQALGVGVLGLEQHLVDRAVLDDPAGVHDHDVVGHLGDDAQVVRDEHHAPCPCCSWTDRMSSRICAWMVTSRAVVGSSAMSSLGSHDERHGDHDALAHGRRTARADTA